MLGDGGRVQRPRQVGRSRGRPAAWAAADSTQPIRPGPGRGRPGRRVVGADGFEPPTYAL